MLKGKIEKGVPFPPHAGGRAKFHTEVVNFLNKLCVGDSAVFETMAYEGYKLQVKVRAVTAIYASIKDVAFVSTLRSDKGGDTLRVWRIR